ncbi:trypsin-like peptidase domain-containing protein [Pseudooceanicola algae]|nr:trypsin-like peptidase domain-containing protein [Pseudooceanicola algae]
MQTFHRPVLTASLIALLTAFGGLSPTLAQDRVPESQAEISLSFAPLVKKAAPAVVNIFAKTIVPSRQSPFANDPFFSQFFGNLGQARPQVQNSLGSGVILSDDGIVVSNYHVVGEADEISIVLNDRREFNAEVLLADAAADLAILKLEDAHDLPYLALRDSDDVEVGELVLAIGNPFGVGQTVSSGIVSGLARSGAAAGSERGYFIQTDAPINPGNSGGALIDVKGDLIGVNTSILSRSGGSNGIGFAIPAALIEQFVAQARDGAAVFRHPWAGMTGHGVDTDMAGALGLDHPEGIVIDALHEDSPFAAAGFTPGDVILAVDGNPISSPAEMVFRMSVKGMGGKAQIERLRDGERSTIAVPMTTAPEEPARDPVETTDKGPIPGMTLVTVNPAVIAEYQLPLTTTGAMVQEPGQVGQRAGLRPGDVLLAVNGDETETSRDADKALSRASRSLQLDVLRGGRKVTMRFRL